MENNNESYEGYDDDGVYYAKGTFDNEIEYNNEIICLVNYTDDYFVQIGKLISEKEFEEVEVGFKEFLKHNESAIEGLNELGAYKGDDELLNTAISYINELSDILKTDYYSVFKMIQEEPSTQQEFEAKRDKFSTRMQKNAEMLNQAFQEFLEKYDEEEEEEDDDLFGDFGNLYQGMERKEFDASNPMLQPIHGISLEDYAAAAAKMVNGMSEDEVTKALGVERPQWDEANQMWIQRMQQDTDMVVIGLYGQYFSTAESHPKFQNLSKDSSVVANQENLSKIKEDPEFYFDLTCAMQAAYNQGLDGAQWLRENYGLSIGDFQSVAMQWAYSPIFVTMMSSQPQRTKEYEAKFAKESGGNIADDIDF